MPPANWASRSLIFHPTGDRCRRDRDEVRRPHRHRLDGDPEVRTRPSPQCEQSVHPYPRARRILADWIGVLTMTHAGRGGSPRDGHSWRKLGASCHGARRRIFLGFSLGLPQRSRPASNPRLCQGKGSLRRCALADGTSSEGSPAEPVDPIGEQTDAGIVLAVLPWTADGTRMHGVGEADCIITTTNLGAPSYAARAGLFS